MFVEPTADDSSELFETKLAINHENSVILYPFQKVIACSCNEEVQASLRQCINSPQATAFRS